MDHPTRRELLGMGSATLLAPLAAARPSAGRRWRAAVRIPRIKIAVSTYSYWHFRTEKYPIEKVIAVPRGLGFDGVEILPRQMAEETPAYGNKLKQLAFRHGLALPMLSIHQDFVSGEADERRKDIAHTRSASNWRRGSGFRRFG